MNITNNALRSAILAAFALLPGMGTAQDTIKLGSTVPFSGPASAYGTIGTAMERYFGEVNAKGGINGRKVEFIVLDDGYSPPKAVEQVRKLVEREEVLAMVATLGTPPNSAIQPYLNAKKVPHLFINSGASKWNDPEAFPWSMGWQPDYRNEGIIFAQYIKDTHTDGKVGVLYQNDDFGKDYLEGLREGLGDKADMIVAAESYEVSDPTVDSQMLVLQSAGADVLVNASSPKFAAQAIRKAHELSWKPVHLLANISNSVASVLEPAGLEASEGLITTLFFKDPSDPQWNEDPEMVEWRRFMTESYPDGNQNSGLMVIAYGLAKSTELVLQQAGDDLSRENIMKVAASLDDVRIPMLLPGITLATGADDFAPIEAMQLARFEGGRWVLFGDIIDASAE